MQKNNLRVLQRASFLMALLLHLLLLLSFSIVLVFQPQKEETPALFIPSYISQNIDKEVVKQPQQKVVDDQEEKQFPEKNEKEGLASKSHTKKSRSVESSDNAESATPAKAIDGVHLIGKKKLDDPLIKILGQAIGRHLIYPRIALDFGLRGTAYVGFNIRPDGIVTDVRLVQSSNAGVLDEEAVRAIRQMSPVGKVDEYVKETRYLVVGIIFG